MNVVIDEDGNPTWHFAPSQSEPFTMTPVEMDDVMAFVRQLKVNADSQLCPQCGGHPGMTLDTYPPMLACRDCNATWTP